MAAEELIKVATHGSSEKPLKIGGTEIPCYVLEDGTRVLSQRGLMGALQLSYGSRGGADRLASFLNGKLISPFVNKELMPLIENPIKFKHSGGGGIAFGYPATVLADICESVLAAREAGVLQKQQEHIALQAEILIRAFARVGIIALVDEATGYQEQREKDALEQILDHYLNDYARRWSKTFPDEFWIKLIRVKGQPSYMAMKRPAFVGHWVNDIVYDRLAPGIRRRLEELNPRNKGGSRTKKHHQFFTEEDGVNELKEHITKTMVLMDASHDDSQFMTLLDKAMPKLGSNLSLDLPNPNDD